jgi:adenylate cyclase class 2
MNETEVKIAIQDPEEICRQILAMGGVPKHPREFEDNVLLELDGDRLARAGRILRIRRVGDKSVLTVKSPVQDSLADSSASLPQKGYKVRRETEVDVSDARELLHALQDVGFTLAWRYQKWRRSFSYEGVEILVDEIPWGAYLEIEGEPEGIDRAARALGFWREHYEVASYRELHERRCRARGEPVGDLVFAGAAKEIG